MNKARILLVKFDELVQKSLYEMLCRSGYNVEITDSADEALAYLDEKNCHAIIADVSDSSDIEIIKTIKERAGNSKIIVLASYNNLETAVNSMKLGAFDYLLRPVKDKKILSTIERALAGKSFEDEKPAEKKKHISLKRFLHKGHVFYDLVGKGEKAREINELIERISTAKTTILLHGESGTGKRLIAQAIHKADKKRRNKAFIEVSCGALPREIIESELFGHTKGAFTGAVNDRKGRFELANGGTILLDDIDSLPLDLQVKLLRVLQQKEFERVGDHKTMKVDIRVIATTNQDIKNAVQEKKFREDLYYRINVISINVPPLRERKEDLSLLIDHFIHLYSKENHKKIKGISQETVQALIDYNWPGNIRELENIIERAIILDIDGIINKDDLPEIIVNKEIILRTEADGEAIKKFTSHLKEAMKEPEKVHILRVLKEVSWNKKKAAKILGVNRTTLYNKLKKYNFVAPSESKN